MTKNFLNLIKEIKVNMQETQQTPSKMNSKTLTLKHVIINFLKDKDIGRILKEGGEKLLIIYEGTSMRLSAEFSYLQGQL